jgi:hypothetical protein
MISLKNSAPSAETLATSQAAKTSIHAVDSLSVRVEGCVLVIDELLW